MSAATLFNTDTDTAPTVEDTDAVTTTEAAPETKAAPETEAAQSTTDTTPPASPASATRKPKTRKSGRGLKRDTPPEPEAPETTTGTPEIDQPGETPAAQVPPSPEAASDTDDGGITAALAAARQLDGATTGEIMINPEHAAPHPFNSPARSAPQPGNGKWDELVSTIRAKGVTVAAKVVTRAAFLAVRPETETLIGDAQYVIIYGHRRRAACIEAGRPLKVITDDAVMANDGDIEALAQENYGREDLTELEDARMLTQFFGPGSKESQRTLARRLGRDQATISRRLALLKTGPEIQAAVEAKEFPAPDAAVIGGKLPYEPDAKKKDGRETPERLADQMAAFALVKGGRTATAACLAVITARESRTQAEAEGIELINPRDKFGDRAYQHALQDEAAVEAARQAGTLVATIDQYSGQLVYYTTAKPAKPEPTDRETAEKAEAKARRDAMTARREACVKLVTAPLPQRELLPLLARQYANGLAQRATSTEAYTLAGKWWFASGVGPNFGDEFRQNIRTNEDPKLDLHAAWVLAVAAFEINASSTQRTWGPEDLEYFELLDARAKYMPTEWEKARLVKAIKAQEAADAGETTPSDEDQAADD